MHCNGANPDHQGYIPSLMTMAMSLPHMQPPAPAESLPDYTAEIPYFIATGAVHQGADIVLLDVLSTKAQLPRSSARVHPLRIAHFGTGQVLALPDLAPRCAELKHNVVPAAASSPPQLNSWSGVRVNSRWLTVVGPPVPLGLGLELCAYVSARQLSDLLQSDGGPNTTPKPAFIADACSCGPSSSQRSATAATLSTMSRPVPLLSMWLSSFLMVALLWLM
jgi:hypothetical protein